MGLAKPPRKAKLLVASACLATATGLVYQFKPISLAAIYIWPMTLWVVLGIGMVAVAIKAPARSRWVLGGIWIVLWFALDDQPGAFIPNVVSDPTDEVRVVSLNCAGGDIRAAEEAVATGTKLVLLQESPGSAELEKLRARLGPEWSCVAGPDGSILAKGELSRVPVPRRTSNFTAVIWNETLVVSLRLQPPVFRLDYWSPACWKAFADNRAARIQELAAVNRWIEEHRGARDLIVGGDFNSPPDPALMGSLDRMAVDVFAKSGWGWGGTAINSFPVVRIDQIWVGGSWWHARSWVRKSRISDHRMLIAEIYQRT